MKKSIILIGLLSYSYAVAGAGLVSGTLSPPGGTGTGISTNNDPATFLNGQGNWALPPSTSGATNGIEKLDGFGTNTTLYYPNFLDPLITWTNNNVQLAPESGNFNVISNNSSHNVLGGGQHNTMEQGVQYSVIMGGHFNTMLYGGGAIPGSVIAGGERNTLGPNAQYSVIGGGYYNIFDQDASYSTIIGGFSNRVDGNYSVAMGRQANVTNTGSFVFSDSGDTNFYSTANDQFRVRARGGVDFETFGAGLLLDGAPISGSGLSTQQVVSAINENTEALTNTLGSPTGIANGASANGGGLTNLNGANIVGTVPLATTATTAITATNALSAIDPLALTYCNAISLADIDARAKVNGFFQELRAGGLIGGLHDAAFLANDLNNPASLKSAVRLATGTNTAGATFDRYGINLFGATNRLYFPIALANWNFTIVVDMVGVSNTIALTAPVEFGLYDASLTNYLISYPRVLQTKRGGSFSDNGSVYNPFSSGTVWFDGREEIHGVYLDNANGFWGQYLDSQFCTSASSNAATSLLNSPAHLYFGMRNNAGSFDIGSWESIRAWAIFTNSAFTSNQWLCVQRAFAEVNQATVNFVVLGDSTSGPSDTKVQQNWPWQYLTTGNNGTSIVFTTTRRAVNSSVQTSLNCRGDSYRFGPHGRVKEAICFIGGGGGAINSIGTALLLRYMGIVDKYRKLRPYKRVYDPGSDGISNLANSPSSYTLAMLTNLYNFNSNIVVNPQLYSAIYRKDLLFNSNDVATLSYDGFLHMGTAGENVVARQVQGIIPNYTNTATGDVSLFPWILGQWKSLR